MKRTTNKGQLRPLKTRKSKRALELRVERMWRREVARGASE